MTDLKIAHLYPVEMNIYGDTGNVITLRRRMEWRGMSVGVHHVQAGEPFDFTEADLVFSGGGQDRSQVAVAEDLQRHRHSIIEAVEAGVVFLTVCGTYQLFGRRFVTRSGDELPGIGVFAMDTFGSDVRMIGNVVVDTPWGRLVGFENHSGRTVLDPGQPGLGRVVKGFGNNDSSTEEGAIRANAFGTYLHGSLLPKNPGFADELLTRALGLRHGPVTLAPLDDRLERQAAEVAATRP